MREPPPPVESASSSAFTSSRVRPTTSSRFSQSADALRTPLASSRAQRRTQLLQQPLVAHNQQRLRRLMQQVEEVTAISARIEIAAVGQQLHASSAASRVEQAGTEPVPEDFENLVELVDGETAAPQIGKHEQ